MGVNGRRVFVALLNVFMVVSAAGCSGSAPPSQAERVFVAHVSHVLQTQFPRMKSAELCDYRPISDKLDAENTYNLTDMKFEHITLEHPNFLWYDRHGDLAGVDYEFPKSRYRTPPKAYSVDASRWTSVDEHIHFAYTLNGKTQYAEESAKPNLRSTHITASDLRADGFLPQRAILKWAMYHPAAWDLALWVVPNPNGAFADSNPLVK